MSSKKAIIFDLGGVLLRTENYEPRHAWDRRLSLPPGTVESVVHGIGEWQQAQCGVISIEQYWQAVSDRLHLNPWELTSLQHDFYAGDRLDLSLIDLIRRLRKEAIGIGLLSNNTLDVLDLLSALKIRSLFDACVISVEIGVMKPDPAAYQAILERLGLPPGATLFVDDAPENVDSAHACGMGSIRFSPNMDLETEIRRWLSTRVGLSDT